MENRGCQKRFLSCYDEWMNQQISDLDDLLATRSSTGAVVTDEQLRTLVEKSMAHYEDYMAKRRELAKTDAAAFYCPTWCATIENSLMWLGGCRPAVFIRLVYAASGSDFATHFHSNTGGGIDASSTRMAALSTSQLRLVEDLHRKTVASEDKLTSWMATVQEDIADKPMLSLVSELGIGGAGEGGGESSSSAGFPVINCAGGGGEAATAMERYAAALEKILEEADGMRVATARKLVTEILTPQQAVELLAVAKQLHLSVHEWGKIRDREHGRA